MKKLLKLTLLAVTSSWVSFQGVSVEACGPIFPEPVFTVSVRPENFADFAQGKLGILQPNLYRSVLFAAYRILEGAPFSANEQKGLLRSWQTQYEKIDANQAAKQAAIEQWLAARKSILGTAAEVQIEAFRASDNGYDYFLNCTAGAFDNASKTLKERATSDFDKNHLQDWLTAQDQVFANCSATTASIPAEAASDAPDWLKYDRAYQIAAAHFYAMHYDDAKIRFAEIAGNKASPWHELAAYLMARAAVRKAPDALAVEQINAVLANPELSDYHAAAKQLLNFVNFRLHPAQLHEALAKKLLEKTENPQLFQDLTDYRRLLNKAEVVDYEDRPDAKTVNASFRQASDLSDWLFTVQAKDADAFAHALDRWQTSKHIVWLVASLMKAPKDTPATEELLSAAQAINQDSPAYLTVNYYAAKLQIGTGKTDAARSTLDTVLANSASSLNKIAISQLYALRLSLAQNVDEFVQFAQRRSPFFILNYGSDAYEWLDGKKPDGEDYFQQERAWLSRDMFDVDAVRAMNAHMPLAILKQIALHPKLPDYLKRRVVMSVWTRALLLEDDQTVQEFAPHLAHYLPELSPFVSQLQKADSKPARFFEGIWLLLKNPAMRPVVMKGQGRMTAFNEIDSMRDNWWCDADFSGPVFNEMGEAVADLPIPGFLTPQDIATAATENAKIAALQGGANYLANQTVEWAKFNAKDKRLPEALHLAVKATRYGCQNCTTGKASKAAFDVLGKQFKSSEWKKKTPYWFEGYCQK